MPELFGHTRARVAARHALITPDNHVASVLPGVTGATSVILINEAMGARFAQILITFGAEGAAEFTGSALETFGYIMSGGLMVKSRDGEVRCESGGYFFMPPGASFELVSPEPGTQLTLFQKRYVELPGALAPAPFTGNAADVAATPFLGDSGAMLQTLLPDTPAFDMAVNVFTWTPGAHLPFVEIHVMEHGLLMLEGQGIYRMEESWMPVQAGDAIWMAPYCPQWFVAMGKSPARYLYYKDVNRSAL